MSTRTENYLEAVELLPEDALLVLHNVSWSEYEELLEDLLSWPGMRVAYNRGRLAAHENGVTASPYYRGLFDS